MPFTGAHPTAILPVLRIRGLDPTGLVIGSMTPDFEYFLRGELTGTFSHSLLGIPVFCVPVTLAVAVVFHGLVKRRLIAVAPAWVRRRDVGGPWRERWTAWAVAAVIISAAFGAFTHVVWDSFTHAKGWGVAHFRVLHQPYDLPVLGEMVLHRILQYAFSVIGLAIVVAYAVRAIRRRPAIAPVPARLAARLVFAGCACVGIAILVARLLRHDLLDPGSVVVGVIAGALAGVIVASAIVGLAFE